MSVEREAVCSALDGLAAAIKSGWTGEQNFCEAWGWNCPAVTRHDMANLSAQLAEDLRSASDDAIDDDMSATLSLIPKRIQTVQANIVPQFWGGNNGAATAAYVSTIATIRQLLAPLVGWTAVSDKKLMPAPMARRLRALQAEIDQIVPNKDALASQITDIQIAHDAAESLPIDIQSLKDARERVAAFAATAALSSETVKSNAGASDALLTAIKQQETAAAKLVGQCEEAYRITTTKGLAAAFDQRAKRLGLSMVAWVVGLLAALTAGSLIGSVRLAKLSTAIQVPSPEWGIVLIHIVLAIVSVGAPVWFAWIATKQIGQRFRLSEDYAFKASVAKAYEGYRREAARISPEFEARLFDSALGRLEEAPLRLVEQATPGSPWHEFFASEPFNKAMDSVPELRKAFIEQVRRITNAISQPTSSGSKD